MISRGRVCINSDCYELALGLVRPALVRSSPYLFGVIKFNPWINQAYTCVFARTLVGLHDDRIVSIQQNKSITLWEVAFIHGSPPTAGKQLSHFSHVFSPYIHGAFHEISVSHLRSIFGTGHIKTSLVSWGMDHQCWCRRWAPAGWSYMSLSLSSSASILDYLTFAKSKGYYTWLLWQSYLKWWCFGWFWDRIKSWSLRRPNPAGTHRSRDACRLRGSGITFIDP